MGKIAISPGQAILLLIKHLKNNPQSSNKDSVGRLETIYLIGVESEIDLSFVLTLIKQNEKLFEKYDISKDFNVINEDPTRRLFETHLAYHSMPGAEKLPGVAAAEAKSIVNEDIRLDALKRHLADLKLLLPPEEVTRYENFLQGRVPIPKDHPEFMWLSEYHEAWKKIDTSPRYKNFSPEAKAKQRILIESAFWGVKVAQRYNTTLPLALYGRGMFAPDARGIVPKAPPKGGEAKASVSALGLMKAGMPLPKDDITTTVSKLDFVRSADKSTFNALAAWCVNAFATLTNPFSNSISGTLLCQLRVLKYFHDRRSLSFDDLTNYLRGFISVLLYTQGGHSLKEFMAVLRLPEIQAAFSFMPNFKDITVQKLFYELNKTGFEKALSAAIAYNDDILSQAISMQERMMHADQKLVDKEILSQPAKLDVAQDEVEELKSKFYENEARRKAILEKATFKVDLLAFSRSRHTQEELTAFLIINARKSFALAEHIAADPSLKKLVPDNAWQIEIPAANRINEFPRTITKLKNWVRKEGWAWRIALGKIISEFDPKSLLPDLNSQTAVQNIRAILLLKAYINPNVINIMLKTSELNAFLTDSDKAAMEKLKIGIYTPVRKEDLLFMAHAAIAHGSMQTSQFAPYYMQFEWTTALKIDLSDPYQAYANMVLLNSDHPALMHIINLEYLKIAVTKNPNINTHQVIKTILQPAAKPVDISLAQPKLHPNHRQMLELQLKVQETEAKTGSDPDLKKLKQALETLKSFSALSSEGKTGCLQSIRLRLILLKLNNPNIFAQLKIPSFSFDVGSSESDAIMFMFNRDQFPGKNQSEYYCDAVINWSLRSEKVRKFIKDSPDFFLSELDKNIKLASFVLQHQKEFESLIGKNIVISRNPVVRPLSGPGGH